MDAEYQIFPTRKELSETKVPFRPVKYTTNFYPVKLNLSFLKVFQYQVKIDIPDDSA